MAKSEAEILAKKEKKEKKRKLEESAEDDGVAAAKKEKKDKKRKSTGAAVADESAMDVDASVVADTTDDSKIAVPLAALVPFANPLADEKAQKKVLKSVKKAAKHKALKRGVKECVKAIRKSAPSTPAAYSPNTLPQGIVILAADISPMDVISHIPVLCEDHNIPYVYVPSRAELGAAGSTKRPTSVVMLTPSAGKKGKDAAAEDPEDWQETYKDLHKLAVKLGQHVKV